MKDYDRPRIIITEYRGKIFWGLWENGRPAELSFHEPDSGIRLNDIYLAKVQEVVPGLQAAFVGLTHSDTGFLPFEKAPDVIHPGDELMVQVTRQAQKTKCASVSSRISLAGRLCVLVTDRGSGSVAVSSKIKDREWRQNAISSLRPLLDCSGRSEADSSDSSDSSALPVSEPRYGFIVRTSAYNASMDDLVNEASSLIAKYRNLIVSASTRVCYSRLCASDPDWLTRLYSLNYPQRCTDLQTMNTAEIVTDSAELYDICSCFLTENNLTNKFSLRMYTDSSYPLAKLYSLDSVIQSALDRRVWLKSGGYLIIDIAEAMTVIDVNSGKYQGKKDKEENILRINLEAADEAARQMRLRNLSGIILIDFIDMKEESHAAELLDRLRADVMNDPVSVNVVDITRLGIVECTRRKIYKPLYEQLRSLN